VALVIGYESVRIRVKISQNIAKIWYSNQITVNTIFLSLCSTVYFSPGEVDKDEKLTGHVVFLYPNLTTAILATYREGKMIRGTYARLTAVTLPPPPAALEDELIIPRLSFETAATSVDNPLAAHQLQFDPSTFLRISRTPLVRDAYETAAIRVALSTISPLAGEGLFARRRLGKEPKSPSLTVD
jgi:hypothetical protein